MGWITIFFEKATSIFKTRNYDIIEFFSTIQVEMSNLRSTDKCNNVNYILWTVIFVEKNLKSTSLFILLLAWTHVNTISV